MEQNEFEMEAAAAAISAWFDATGTVVSHGVMRDESTYIELVGNILRMARMYDLDIPEIAKYAVIQASVIYDEDDVAGLAEQIAFMAEESE